MSTDQQKHWLVRPKTITWLWRIGILILALTVAAELMVHTHSYFGIDGTFGFNAWFGFLSCAAMVVGAKVLGIFLKRGEDYYD